MNDWSKRWLTLLISTRASHVIRVHQEHLLGTAVTVAKLECDVMVPISPQAQVNARAGSRPTSVKTLSPVIFGVFLSDLVLIILCQNPYGLRNMFKKKPQIKPAAPLRSSDRRKLAGT
jgi:hypothetical protein